MAVQAGGQQRFAPRTETLPVGQQLAEVLKDDDPVAEQAPALFGVRSDDVGGVAVGGVGSGQRGVCSHASLIPVGGFIVIAVL